MPPEEFEVDCPCCHGRLWIDARTRKVVRHARAEHVDSGGERSKPTEADWEAARERVSGRSSTSARKMEEAIERERSRGDDLDALFDEISRKKRSADED